MRQLLYMLIGFFIISLSACKTLPSPSNNTAVNIKDSIVYNFLDSVITKEVTNTKDSVIYRDSVVTVVDENGNVIRTELYRQKEIYRELQSKYTELQARYNELLKKYEAKDSTVIKEPYPVEKELSLWQKIKITIGEVSLMLIGVLLLIVILQYKNKS